MQNFFVFLRFRLDLVSEQKIPVGSKEKSTSFLMLF